MDSPWGFSDSKDYWSVMLKYLFIIMVLFSTTLNAAMLCRTTEDFVKYLKNKYNENPISIGIINKKTLFMLFVSPKGATWTAVTRHADGIMCFLATGKHFQIVKLKP